MSASNVLLRLRFVLLLTLCISGGALAGSISIDSPSNLALFQHTNGSADIPVSVTASGVPEGGGIWYVLDGDTSNQVSGVTLSLPYSYTFRSVAVGEHKLDVYIVDHLGNLTGDHDSRVKIGVGDLIVCVGDSITAGEDDNITSDDHSADGRNGPYVDPIDNLPWGGFEPILNDLLTAARGYPNSVINRGLGTETSAGGLTRLPGIISEFSNANTWLIAYGTNDIRAGVSLATYESNLTQMTNAILTANPNAKIYVPKILYGGQPNLSSFIDRIGDAVYTTQSLNWGADLYTTFQENFDTYNRMTAQSGTWYAVDTVPHPNGIGYQHLAKYWELALDQNAFIIGDGKEPVIGTLSADKVRLSGVNNAGLGTNELLIVSRRGRKS